MAMTDEEREKRAEDRAKIERKDRVRMVFTLIDKATKAGTRISAADLSKQTGLSEDLVRSTINFISQTMDPDYGASQATKMINYAPARQGDPGGYRVSKSWDDQAKWFLTLHAHTATRTESLSALADVAEGIWPGGAPQGLGDAYRVAISALDMAGGLIGKLKGLAGKAGAPKRARRGVKMIP